MTVCHELMGTQDMSRDRLQPSCNSDVLNAQRTTPHLSLQLLSSQPLVGLLQLLPEGGNLRLDQQPNICGQRHCKWCLHPKRQPWSHYRSGPPLQLLWLEQPLCCLMLENGLQNTRAQQQAGRICVCLPGCSKVGLLRCGLLLPACWWRGPLLPAGPPARCGALLPPAPCTAAPLLPWPPSSQPPAGVWKTTVRSCMAMPAHWMHAGYS